MSVMSLYTRVSSLYNNILRAIIITITLQYFALGFLIKIHRSQETTKIFVQFSLIKSLVKHIWSARLIKLY